MITLNIIWPTLLRTENLLWLFALIMLSVLIEAVFIYLIRNKNILKAVWISAAINIISALFGYLLMLAFDDFFRRFMDPGPWLRVCTLTVSAIISTLIESFTYIQLWKGKPGIVLFWFFIGNLITYVLTYLFTILP